MSPAFQQVLAFWTILTLVILLLVNLILWVLLRTTFQSISEQCTVQWSPTTSSSFDTIPTTSSSDFELTECGMESRTSIQYSHRTVELEQDCSYGLPLPPQNFCDSCTDVYLLE